MAARLEMTRRSTSAHGAFTSSGPAGQQTSHRQCCRQTSQELELTRKEVSSESVIQITSTTPSRVRAQLTLTRRLSGELSGLSSVGSIPLGRNGTLDGTLNSGVSSNESGGLLGVVGLDLIRVSVEEQVGEDGPSLSVDGSSETEDLSAEEVPDLRGTSQGGS